MDSEKTIKLWGNIIPEIDKSDPQHTYKDVNFTKDITVPLDFIYKTITSTENESQGETNNSLATQSVNYILLNEITRGGMGIIFKGKQNSLMREIAIKKIIPNKENSASKSKFISESLVTAYLEHPNIVPVHELSQDQDGGVILAMKLVGGLEWKHLLHPRNDYHKEKANSYDLEAHLGILLNVCNAVAYAHSKDIIHNDLKPSNIMVGEFGEVLVMDWGIAVNVKDKDKSDEITIHKSMVKSPMGTPCYMPWELAEGVGENIGPWTDVYLLGGILYHILMGKPPHGESTIGALVAAVTGKLPTFEDKIPRELQQICHKAMAKEIEKRYQAVEDFRKDLQNYLKHRESLMISDTAQTVLNKCCNQIKNELLENELDILYTNFSKAIFGFDQAVDLWNGNEDAKQGQQNARIEYAKIAFAHEDFGLANAQIATIQGNKEVDKLKVEIEEARDKKLKLKLMAEELQKKIVEQRNDAYIQLAQIALRKSEETYQQLLDNIHNQGSQNVIDLHTAENLYNQCGAYALESLKFLKSIEVPNTQQENQIETAKKTSYVMIWICQNRSYSSLLWSNPGGKNIYNEKSSISFSPDGNFLVFNTCNNSLLIHDLITKKDRKVTFPSRVDSVTFSPDGKYVAVGLENNKVYLYDIDQDVKYLFEGHCGSIEQVVFNCQGTLLASAAKDFKIKIWDLSTHQLLHTFEGHNALINAIAFSPDGTILVSASCDRAVRTWNISTKQQELLFEGTFYSVAFHPNQNSVALASKDNDVIIVNLETKQEEYKFRGHCDYVFSTAFSKDGKYLASASCDKSVKIWNFETRKQVYAIEETFFYNSIAFNPNYETIACNSENYTTKMWKLGKNKPVHNFRGHSDYILSVLFEGQFVVSGSWDTTVRIWDTTNKHATKVVTCGSPVNSISLNRDNTLVAAGTHNAIELYNIQTLQKVSVLEGHSGPLSSLVFSADNNYIISGSLDTTIRIWDIGSKKEMSILNDHSDYIKSLALHPNGKTLFSGSWDKTVRVWDLEKRTSSIFDTHDSPVDSITISPDGLLLASLGKTVKLWDIQKNKQILVIALESSEVVSLAFSPRNSLIALGLENGNILLQEIITGKQVFSFEGHNESVKSIAFSKDGKYIVSGSSDHIVKIWRLPRIELFKYSETFNKNILTSDFSYSVNQDMSLAKK
ncbi:protein kinase domain-containing protein [Candidatus Uabimicrobium amorphum]|uniref:Protein kinase domain-containing protein n=1 Tax=Uabimicrobium amorphum TaxID=2596890 RepID=A0A5S9F6V3_UABAM|nr:protein kinase [Candidatus Uabimicrobium amorphum]BBM86652.1 hypothetical protein UABAM_05038 [Candidatus Uabimicrobium amorphum]